MTGTNINLSDAWIKSYALRVGVSTDAVELAIANFQQAISSYTSMAKAANLEIICQEEGFPRLDDYLPKKVVDSVTSDPNMTAEAQQAAADKEAAQNRAAAQAMHDALRLQQGRDPLEWVHTSASQAKKGG